MKSKHAPIFLFCTWAFLFMHISWLHAQEDNVVDVDSSQSIGKKSTFEISTYIDLYYGGGLGVEDESMPYFVSSNSNNELNINLALVDLKYASDGLRMRLTPGFGTYMNANYANESTTLKHLVEASIGIRLSEKRDIWIDLGILGSPYTNENAISRDHLVYTRSLSAENVPYYLSGAKVTIPLSKKLTFYTYLINGWQQIRDNNKAKSLGTQLEYKLNDKSSIYWNTYVGNEQSDFAPMYRTRYFTDVYYIYNPEGKFSLTSCIYLGRQAAKNGNGISNYDWWQMNAIAKYKWKDRWAISGRVEYFNDPDYVIITPLSESAAPFTVLSETVSISYQIRQNAMVRIEGRYFDSKESIFPQHTPLTKSSMFWLVSNVTMWF